MKWGKIIAILIPIISIMCCKKDNSIDNAVCNNLTTVDSWTTISFKTNYTIQVPSGFKGVGMAGFEGNVFNKFSNDTTIILNYAYCNELFCLDFGDTLNSRLPARILVKVDLDNSIPLYKTERFCQNSETIGVLYYSVDTIANKRLYWNGRLYWKDNGLYKQAMQIKFPASGLETVKEIIETIKSK